MTKERLTYTPLHVHSNYSLLPVGRERGRFAAVSSPDELVSSAKRKGIEALALTDTTFFGFGRFMRACEEADLTPIPAVELPVEFSPIDAPSSATLLARNNEGLNRLFALTTKVQRDGQLLTPNDLEGQSDKLIVLVRGKLAGYYDLVSCDGIFVAIDTPVTSSESQRLLLTLEKQTGKTVVAHEVRMADPSDVRVFNLILKLFKDSGRGINTNSLFNYTLKAPLEISALYRGFGSAIGRTLELAQDVHVSLPKAPRLAAKIVGEEGKGKNSDEFLESLVWKLAEKIPGHEKLAQRIAMELSVIAELGYSDLFLIHYEIKRFCRQNNIQNSDTGSGTNSVVLSLPGGTPVDERTRNFLFERFINRERLMAGHIDFPDIDIELDSAKRQRVVNFVLERYGNASLLGEVHMLGRKGVVQLEKSRKIQLTREERQMLVQAELPYRVTTHPGVVFIDNPPQIVSGKNVIGQLDKVDVDDILHLPKIDLLGKIWATRIAEIKRRLRAEGEALEEIPENDPKALSRLFFEAKTIGISYVESPHLRRLLKRIGQALAKTKQAPTLDHLSHALSLARPAAARGRQRYQRDIHGEISVFERTPEIAEILGKTNFVIVNQEQLMQIATKVADLPASFADQLRKILSKGGESEERKRLIDSLSARFFQKYPAFIAQELKSQVESFAGYGFVEGHAYALARISCKLAYLVEHYPAHFWAAVCEVAAEKPGVQLYPYQAYVNEALRDGIEFVFPHPREITSSPEVVQGTTKQIMVGHSLLRAENFNTAYLGFCEKLLQQAISPQGAVRYQLENFGVSHTDNPIVLFDKRLHFNPACDVQKIVGMPLLTRRYEDICFLTLDSGGLLDLVITVELARKHKELLGESFWHLGIHKDRQHKDTWIVHEVLPITKTELV